eukprot:8433384-Pyramimonas_sp.AAC.1
MGSARSQLDFGRGLDAAWARPNRVQFGSSWRAFNVRRSLIQVRDSFKTQSSDRARTRRGCFVLAPRAVDLVT